MFDLDEVIASMKYREVIPWELTNQIPRSKRERAA
jgi:hypothetical protein